MNKYKLELRNKILCVEPLEIVGSIYNIPTDKTYQNRLENVCYLKLEIFDGNLIVQRLHSLYKNSKKGYYCIVCGKKVYFKNEDIDILKNKLEQEKLEYHLEEYRCGLDGDN